MGGFWSGLGNSLEQYEASKSPAGAMVYDAATGKMVPPQAGKTNPAMILAGALIGKYRGAHNGSTPSTPAPTTTTPTQPMQGTPTPAPLGLIGKYNSTPSAQTKQDVSIGPQSPNYGALPAIASATQSNGSSSPPGGVQLPNGTYGNGNDPGSVNNNTGFDGSDSSGNGGTSTDSTITYDGGGPDPGNDGGGIGEGDPNTGDDYALGGVIGRPQIARVAEAGPELAGGQIVSKPSIVKLNKGDTVVPLTPRANNKLQPDMLEGRIAGMKPQGEQFSRFQRYGQGRGLMR